jgi:hypothetical protein
LTSTTSPGCPRPVTSWVRMIFIVVPPQRPVAV